MRFIRLALLAAASLISLGFASGASAQLIESVASGLVNPFGVAVDGSGNVYIADTDNQRIQVVNRGTSPITIANVTIQPGNIATVAGNGTAGYTGDGGPATNAELYDPFGVAVDAAGNIYIADLYNFRVRKVNVSGIISTVAGNGIETYSGDNGPATSAGVQPYALAVDAKGILYIADAANARIRAVNTGSSAVTLANVTIQPDNIATIAGDGNYGVSTNGTAAGAEFADPYGIAVDSNGNAYVCDTYNRSIRVVNTGTSPITVAGVTIQPGNIATVAGNGNYGFRGDGNSATSAEFADPDGVAVDRAGNIYVSDTENERIRMVDNATGLIHTLAGIGVYGYNGDGILAASAQISYPRAIAADKLGNVFFADEPNLRVREIAVNPGVPEITSRNSTAFMVGVPGTFTVTTADSPLSSLSESGALPGGVTFTDNGNGTGTLSGTPATATGSPFAITFTASNGVLPNATQNFTLTIYPPGAAPSATFVAEDATTQGSWQGKYGADGYVLANVTEQSIPAYASFSVQNQIDYTWDKEPSSPRALQIPGSAGAIAAAWYSNSSFYFDLNEGAAPRQFAMYAVDWDYEGRAETIRIFDANSGALLDSEAISNFSGGVYLVWNITGHVQIIVTPTTAANAVIGGVFFGGEGTLSTPDLGITKSHTGNFRQGQLNATYTVRVSNLANAAPTNGPVTVTETLPSGLALVSMAGTEWSCAANSCTRSDALQGGASYPAISVNVNVAVNAISPQVNQVSVSTSGSATANTVDSTIITAVSGPAAATFLKEDTTTGGSWEARYGADGYALANATTQTIPPYAAFAVQNQMNYTWAASTADPRALQVPGTPRGFAAAWYSPSSFSFALNVGASSHQFAMYAVDWDNQGRAETIQIKDAASGTLLSSRTISNFHGGAYLVWTISGDVIISVTANSGPNAVISGVFFGGGASSVAAIAAAGGTPQSAHTGTPFTTPLQTTVLNNGNPVSGVTVTFTAPGSGPSGTFTGGVATATATTNSSGVATAPAFTANSTVGGPYAVTATASGVSGTAAFALTNTQPNSAGGCSGALCASFVAYDSVTQGNWQGVHGADGYSLANAVAQKIPAYATFAVQNQLNYTWAPSTTDPRALQIPGTSSGIASAWYSPGTFILDVDFTDGNSHLFSLYALDWDNQGRVETVQVLDPSTGAVLDVRSISNFGNGMYLTWNISGHVKISIASVVGPNGVVNGVFFGGGGSSISVLVNPRSINMSSTGTQQFTATVNGTANQDVTWTISPAVGSISPTGLYTPPATITAARVVGIIATSKANGSSYGTAIVNLTAGAVANFVAYDSVTEGSWQGVYGADGYSLANVSVQKIPSYATVAVQGQVNYTWNPSTGDPRALQLPGETGGIAAAWFSPGPFSFDLNFTDGNSHPVALYALDWDNQGRAETIQIQDANTNAVLDIRNISAFANGIYLIWNVSAHVKVSVTPTAGPNAVISGLFFK
ncbi:MAG: hypothetical protein ACRD4C_10765 [Candidatus Acidiferrales bacterium]